MEKRLYLIAAAVLFISNLAMSQQVVVSIPDTTVVYGDTILLPVMLDDTVSGLEILSFQMELEFYSIRLLPISIVTAGSIADTMASFSYNLYTPNAIIKRIKLNGAHTHALADSGILFYIKMVVLGTYPVRFINTNIFNEGNPEMITQQGNITSLNPPQVQVYGSGAAILIPGEQKQFTAYNGIGNYLYSVNDTTIATIDTNGLLTAIYPGNVYVIAQDSAGNVGQSIETDIYIGRLSGRDTSVYSLDTTTVLIETTDLALTPISSGQLRFTYQTNRLELLNVTAGPLLAGGATPIYTEGNYGQVNVVFAGAQQVSGSGTLLKLQFVAKHITSNATTYITFNEILLDENYPAIGVAGLINITGLPVLNLSGGSGFIFAGETRKFTVNNGIPPFNWSVNDPDAAVIDETGLLIAQRSGYVTVSAQDSIGSQGSAAPIQIYDARLRVESICGEVGDTVLVPVFLTALPEDQELGSFKFKVQYRVPELEYVGYQTTSTSSDGWSIFEKEVISDDIEILAAGATTSTGNQPIIFLKFRVTNDMSLNETAYVNLQDVLLNEGVPLHLLYNGSVIQSTLSVDSIQVLAQSSCDIQTNKFSQTVKFFFTNAPLTGNLIVNDTSFTLNGTDTLTATLILDSDGKSKHLYCRFLPGNPCDFIFYNAFAAPLPCRTNVIYVNFAATGANNGNTWIDAFQSLQTALGSASPNTQVKTEVWVAQGVYKPSSSDRTASFSIPSNIQILGGFVGSEDDKALRNPESNATRLSGDIGSAQDSSDNSYHIVSIDQSDSTAILDGFMLEYGRADGPDPLDQVGGAIFLDRSNAMIKRCTFRFNYALQGGGAVSVYGTNGIAAPTFNNCLFELNETPGIGAAVLNNGFNGNTSAKYKHCSFDNNSALNGGAIHNNGFNGVSDSEFNACQFTNNSASSNGGAIYNFGRQNGQCNILITNCRFWENNASANGGCVYTDAQLGGTGEPAFTNCTFGLNNAGASGTTSYAHTANPFFTNCIAWNGDSTVPITGIITSPTIEYSIVEGGASGVGNINADPLFVDITEGDLRVKGCSPAINAGNNDQSPAGDIRDIPRPFPGGDADIGAYELPGNPFAGSGNIAYVDLNSNGMHNGADFDNGYTNLEAAFLFANCDTSIDTILIADGTYTPVVDSLQRSLLVIDRSLKIFGGYQGMGGPVNQSSDPLMYPTFLSANIGAQNDSTDNLQHVVFIGPNSTNSLLCFLTLKDGYTSDSTGLSSSGSGLYVSGQIELQQVSIMNNSSLNGASALHIDSTGTVILNSCTIQDNTSLNGPAILCRPGGQFIIRNSNNIFK